MAREQARSLATLEITFPDGSGCLLTPAPGHGRGEDGLPNPLSYGSTRDADGESGVWWCVFLRSNPWVESVLQAGVDDPDADWAAELTGWGPLDRGPGRVCHLGPTVRVYPRKVLVRQRWVRDV